MGTVSIDNENINSKFEGLAYWDEFLPLITFNREEFKAKNKSIDEPISTKGIKLGAELGIIPDEYNKVYTIVNNLDKITIPVLVKETRNSKYCDQDGIINIGWSEETEGATFEQESFETEIGKEFIITITKTDPLLEKEVGLCFLANDNDAFFDNDGEVSNLLCGMIKIKFVKAIEYVTLDLKFNNLANSQPLAYAMIQDYKIEGTFTYEQSFNHGQKCPQSLDEIKQKQVYLKHLALYDDDINGVDNETLKFAFKDFWTNRGYDTEKFSEEELLKGLRLEYGNKYTDENGEIKFKILKSSLINTDVTLTISLKDIKSSLSISNYTDSMEIKIKKQTATFESFDGDDISSSENIEINVDASCICNRGMTANDFASLASDATIADRNTYLNGLNLTCNEFGIYTCLEKAHFITQILHESANLSAATEGISSTAYGGFPGRGLMQLTYESAYSAYENFVDDDFTSSNTAKQKLETAPHAYLSAGWFYAVFNGIRLSRGAREDDLLEVSARINGGFNGLNDREAKLSTCKDYLKDLCSESMLDNNTYNFDDSRISSNTVYSFAWGIWHDSKFTCKSGVTKDTTKAIEGYQEVVDSNTTRKDNYNMLREDEFSDFKVTEDGSEHIYLLTVATQRKNTLEGVDENEEDNEEVPAEGVDTNEIEVNQRTQ